MPYAVRKTEIRQSFRNKNEIMNVPSQPTLSSNSNSTNVILFLLVATASIQSSFAWTAVNRNVLSSRSLSPCFSDGFAFIHPLRSHPNVILSFRRRNDQITTSARPLSSNLYVFNRSPFQEITNKMSETSERTLEFASFLNRTDDFFGDTTLHTNQNYAPAKRKKKGLVSSLTSTKVSSKSLSKKNSADKDDFPLMNAIEGREALLAGIAILAVVIGIFSYTQSDAGASLLSSMPLSSSSTDDTKSIMISSTNLLETIRGIIQNPSATLERVVDSVNSMGPFGVVYFGIAYTIAEVLAIPAMPLTASAGYLFGPVIGTLVVLCSASIAASISFAIGRTLLRDYVEEKLQEYPKFAKLDKAIGKEGFKLMLLLRLSPIFPFALSNYLYGALSINFSAFFGGTLLGFTPGTIAYVYTGYIGKALTTVTGDGTSDVYPWYVYLGGLTLFGVLLKVLADTATSIVEEIEAEDDIGDSKNTLF